MKSKLLFLLLLAVLIISCDDDKPAAPSDDNAGKLYVKFINEAASEYDISVIQIRALGLVTEGENPTGDWSENLLRNGEVIKPGQYKYFYLDIPNRHWSKARIGVYSSQGSTIMLHEQSGFNVAFPVTNITHWGNDKRTVRAAVAYSSSEQMILVQSWSDWAGIED